MNSGTILAARALALVTALALLLPAPGRGPAGARAACGRVGTLVGFAVLDSRTLVGSTDAGSMARSTDGGHCWTAATLAVPALHRLGTVLVAPGRRGVLLAGAGNPVRIGFSSTSGLLRSADGGRSWQPVGRGLPGTRFTVTALSASGRAVYAALSCPDELLAIQQRRQPAIQCGRPIYRSDDGGASWRPTALGSEATPPGLPGPDFEGSVLALATAADGSLLAAAAPLDAMVGLYSSGDGGRSWRLAAREPRLRDTSALLALAGRPGAILAGVGAIEQSGQVLRSADGGRTWQPVVSAGVLGADLAVLDFVEAPHALFFVGYRRIFRSGDGGQTWAVLGTQGLPPASNAYLAAGPGGELFLAQVGAVSRSDDGGLHWRQL